MPQREVNIFPKDKYNSELIANSRPKDYVNPMPKDKYDLVVIGAGMGGVISARSAAQLGAKVAIIEKELLGGDCVNFGCVPSKTLIYSAKEAFRLSHCAEHGINIEGKITYDFAKTMERMRAVRAKVGRHEGTESFTKKGIDVFFGKADFLSPSTVSVNGTTISFKKCVIAAGARAAVPPVSGLKEAGFLTNETMFDLTDKPARLAVIGGGVIGCESAQTFARFGVQVYLINRGKQILPQEDRDAVKIVEEFFREDGIEIITGANTKEVKKSAGGKVISLEIDGQIREIEVDEIIVATGRTPNTEMSLEKAGVGYDKNGVKIDDYLCTANKNIYAVGDICTNYKFTHMAEEHARIAVNNMFFPFKRKASSLVLPWRTFTDPEIGHTGMHSEEAEKKGIKTKVFIQPFSDVDRAVIEGDDRGFIKIITRAGTDEILGATVVSMRGNDFLPLITCAIVHKIGLKKLSKVVFSYPTYGEAIRIICNKYNSERLPLLSRKLFGWFSK